MNKENIFCGDNGHAHGDQARIRNYSCPDVSLEEKIDILLSRLSLSSDCARIRRTTSSPLWATCTMIYNSRAQPGCKASFSALSTGQQVGSTLLAY